MRAGLRAKNHVVLIEAGSKEIDSGVGGQYVDTAILMHSLDVPDYAGLPVAAVIAMRTLEARPFAALVAQVFLQSVLAHEDPGTIRARELFVRKPRTVVQLPA